MVGLDSRAGSHTPGPGGPSSSTGQKKAGRTSNLGPQERKPSLDKKPLSTTSQKPRSRNPTPTLPSASSTSAAAAATKQPNRSRTFNSTSPEPSYSGAFVDKQRDSDLSSNAFFRTGEMVWAQIPKLHFLILFPSQILSTLSTFNNLSFCHTLSGGLPANQLFNCSSSNPSAEFTLPK